MTDPQTDPRAARQLVTDLLVRSKERVALGWCQGTGIRRSLKEGVPDRYCPAGSINDDPDTYARVPGDDLANVAGFVAYGLFERVIGGTIPEWNDDPARTHAEVLAAFDAAIELSRR